MTKTCHQNCKSEGDPARGPDLNSDPTSEKASGIGWGSGAAGNYTLR